MSKTLLIDGTNNFIRNYAVVPTLDLEGRPNGGVFGFLRSISYFIHLTDPDKVVIIWDGPGGSRKRKTINENYKEGRKPQRLNRNFDFELENQAQNKIRQRIRLAEYLKDLPITEITIPDIEADDVVGYLVQYLSEDEIVIVSNDKDFYQLLGGRVKMFSPTKKEFVTRDVVHEKFGVYPENFAIARAIVGDPSDNLAGIKGVGFKKLIKHLPFMTEDKKVDLDYVFEFCEQDEKIGKKYLEGREVILSNWKIMQLSSPIISTVSIKKIRDSLEKKLSFNATAVRIKMIKDGINTLTDLFFQPFRILRARGKQYGAGTEVR